MNASECNRNAGKNVGGIRPCNERENESGIHGDCTGNAGGNTSAVPSKPHEALYKGKYEGTHGGTLGISGTVYGEGRKSKRTAIHR